MTHARSFHVRGRGSTARGRYRKRPARPLHGFTLIELLVVIAIISLLVSILLPSLSRAKDLARLVICQTNVRNTGTACAVYADSNGERLPRGGLWNDDLYPTWQHLLNPYLGDAAVELRDFGYETSWTNTGVLLCPSAPEKLPQDTSKYLYVSYCFNVDVWSPGSDPLNDACNNAFPAGKNFGPIPQPAATILLGDGWKDSPDWWYYGRGYYWLASAPNSVWTMGDWITSSHEKETMNMAFVDGHVEPLPHDDLPDLREGMWTIYDND